VNPTDNNQSAETDGGINAEDDQSTMSPLEITADIQLSKREQYYKLYDEFVRAPLLVLWNDWRAIVGMSLVVSYFLVAILGTQFIEPTYTNHGETLMQPFQDWELPLGTNNFGQGVFRQTIHATPDMLKMIIGGGVFTIGVGVGFGTIAGYKGGVVDRILMTITDIFINIPGLPLFVVLAILIGPENPFVVGVILSVNRWAGLARNLRSQVLALRNESFVEASRIMGVSSPSIIYRDIMPEIMPYVLINFVNSSRAIIFASVGLYFIGVLPFSGTNWGIMLNSAYEYGAIYIPAAYHWILAPMIAIFGLSFGLVMLSQSLDQLFNPKIRAKHAKTQKQTTPDEI